MTNTELTLDQLQAIAGGNCTDSEKKKVKVAKSGGLICEERFDCPEDDDLRNDSAKESDTKKSSKPIPFIDDGQDSWASER